MRILVVGAGGVGGNLAARLAAGWRGHHEVSVLARGRSAARIREQGLELRHPAGAVTAHPAVVEALSAARGAELAILAVKEPALEAILADLPGALAPGAWVLPLLNGLPRAAPLAQRLPGALLFESCIYVASSRVEPGVIEQQSPFCRIVLQGIGDAAAAAEPALCALLGGADVTCTASTSIAEEMWTKFLFVCPMAGVTSLHDRTFGEVLDEVGTQELLVTAMDEVVALARLCGVTLRPDAVERALDVARSFPPAARTSMQRDFAEGRPPELEAFSGAVVRLAQQHGVDVPAHRAIYDGLRTRAAAAAAPRYVSAARPGDRAAPLVSRRDPFPDT